MKKFVILLVILIAIMISGYWYVNIAKQKPVNKNIQTNTLKRTKTKPAFTKNEEDANITSEQINSADFEILPTMESVSKAKNQVWAGAFQLVWNDFMDELIKGPVKFIKKQPAMVNLLNKQMFTTKDISESAYYKKWGLASPELHFVYSAFVNKIPVVLLDGITVLEHDVYRYLVSGALVTPAKTPEETYAAVEELLIDTDRRNEMIEREHGYYLKERSLAPERLMYDILMIDAPADAAE